MKFFQASPEELAERKKKLTTEGLERVNSVANRTELENFIENEFSKGVNTWAACARTYLGIIMSEVQFLGTDVFNPEYTKRVETTGELIKGKLREIELAEKPHTDIEAEVFPKDPIDDRPTAPPREVQEEIYGLISSLKWQKSDLVETQ
jgi:hypothetical protein